MRTGLSLDVPADAQQGGEDSARLGGWPDAHSSGLERDVEELRWGFAMFETLSDHAERERLYPSEGFVSIVAVSHDTGKGRHFSEPAAIVFEFDFDRERHPGNVPFGPAA